MRVELVAGSQVSLYLLQVHLCVCELWVQLKDPSQVLLRQLVAAYWSRDTHTIKTCRVCDKHTMRTHTVT